MILIRIYFDINKEENIFKELFYFCNNRMVCIILIIIMILFLFILIYYRKTKYKKVKITQNKYIENNINFNLYKHISSVDEVLKCKFKSSSFLYKSQIPIFILNKDRLYAIEMILNKLITLKKWYNIKIYVLDHYTTYKPTLDYLNTLVAMKKIEIIKLQMKNWFDMIYKELPKLIKDITTQSNNEYYILTDSDICLDYIPDDFINFYIYLLENCEGIEVIGPHISVTSISNYYPKSNWAYKIETDYTSKIHYDIYWSNRFFSLVPSPIDTTFQIRRSRVLFARLGGKMYRSLPPYSILHTDYYINPSNIPKSYLYYVNTSRDVNHSYWN